MRTLGFFLFTVFASTFLMWSAIYSGKPMDIILHNAIGLGLWAVFLLYWARKQKRNRLNQQNKEMFNSYMRDKQRRW